jgi:hypothetical protein
MKDLWQMPFADTAEPINLISMLHRIASMIVALKLLTRPSKHRKQISPVSGSKQLFARKLSSWRSKRHVFGLGGPRQYLKQVFEWVWVWHCDTTFRRSFWRCVANDPLSTGISRTEHGWWVFEGTDRAGSGSSVTEFEIVSSETLEAACQSQYLTLLCSMPVFLFHLGSTHPQPNPDQHMAVECTSTLSFNTHSTLYTGGMPHRLNSISRRHLWTAVCSLIDGSEKLPRVSLVCMCNAHWCVVGSNLHSSILFKYHLSFAGRLRSTQGMLATPLKITKLYVDIYLFALLNFFQVC